MTSGSETYLFRARSAEEQMEREGQVRLILSSLSDAAASPTPVLMGLSQDGVELMTWLMDLGAAPEAFPPSLMIRTMSAGRPGVMMMVTPDTAGRMRAMVERGEIRNRAGASDPSAVRIH
jgi:hypothetical protein